MPLGLDSLRTKGRPRYTPVVLSVRSLSWEEVEARAARTEGKTVEPLQRLSARHRHVARMVAQGAAISEVAIATGLTPARVSQLKNDPTFRDHVSHIQAEQEAACLGFVELAGGVVEGALVELSERIESEPKEFDSTELVSIVTRLGDRIGHAPKRVEEKTVNVNIGARLDQARQRHQKAIEAHVIDVEAEEVKDAV